MISKLKSIDDLLKSAQSAVSSKLQSFGQPRTSVKTNTKPINWGHLLNRTTPNQTGINTQIPKTLNANSFQFKPMATPSQSLHSTIRQAGSNFLEGLMAEPGTIRADESAISPFNLGSFAGGNPIGAGVVGGAAGTVKAVNRAKPLIRSGQKALKQIFDTAQAQQIQYLSTKMDNLGNISIPETQKVFELGRKARIPEVQLRKMTADQVLAEIGGLVTNEQRKLFRQPTFGFDIPNLKNVNLDDRLKGFDIPKLDVAGKNVATKNGTEMFGAAAGFELDEEGNTSFDPAKAAIGIAGIGSVNAIRNKGSVNSYIKRQVAKQKSARGGDTFMDTLKGLRGDIKRKFVDETAAIEDILTTAEKRGKFRLVPAKDIRYQIDKAIRADTLASQFVKDQGLDKVIKQVPDLDAFNQYLIAKQALRVTQKGIKTGRNQAMDRQMVGELSRMYEPFAQQVKQYTDALLDYKVQSGFVSPELATALRREYPDYVPLNRVFSELEEQAMRVSTGRGGPASVGTQNVLKRLKGSEREIINPLESIMEATATAFREGERNRAAQMLVSYKDLPGNPFRLRQIGKGEAVANKHTISAFINGQKVTYETLPEVAEAARNLNPQQFGLLGQLFAVPTRVLRLGAVGVNVPFVLGNLVRDQIFSTVVSQKAMRTSLANPLNFGRALYHAVGHGKLYDDWIRSGSSFTQFDIGRNQTAPTIEKIRAGKSAGSRIAYTAKNPGELLRALENMIGRSEEVTRLQQFGGTRDALLKQGRTPQDAELLAGAASRYNTANFGRKGSWAKVVNGVIPFFSAGIAGARSLVRATAQNPVGTAVRFSTTIGIPVVTATAWNLSDPARREAYADIPDYEKENSLILLPEVPTRDENGNWNAIKIPVTPGLANLMSVVRRQVEGMHGVDNGSTAQLLAKTIGDVTTAGTSLNIGDPKQLVSTFTPQALKPGIEGVLNKNLFTGQDIVSPYMKNLPPEEQVRPNTSGTARLVGGALNVSPLMVENAVGTAFAGTGRQLMNLSDRALASQGVIPEEQIGGRSIGDDLRGRFTLARGGQKANDLYDELEKQKGATQSRNNKIKQAFINGDTATLNSLTKGMTKQQLSNVLSSANERELRDSLTPEQRAIQSYSKAQREELKASRPDLLSDILAVEQAELGIGGKGQLVGNFYVYYEEGSQKMIELDFKVPAPKLSGKEAVDKKLISSYKGKITAKANDVVKLYEQGVITADQAEALLNDLEAQRSKVAGGGGSGKKLSGMPSLKFTGVGTSTRSSNPIGSQAGTIRRLRLSDAKPITAPRLQ